MMTALLLAVTVRVTAAATLSVPEAQIGFRSQIYFRDWGGDKATGDHALAPDGSRSFTISCDHVKAKPLDGKAVFAVSNGIVRADYEVLAREEVDCYYVALVGIGSMDTFAGGALVRDGEVVEIPKAFDTARSGWEKAVRSLTFRDCSGKDVFSLGFDEPVIVSVHDARKWNWNVLQVRLLYAPHGKVSATNPSRLAFRISSPDGTKMENHGPWTVTANKDWVPVDFKPGVAPGSALDFSGLRPNAAVKAGAFGRIVAKGEHFEFERLSGVEQRFYGVNLCRDTCCPDEREIPALVDELARTGYNAVRIHHHENALVKPYTTELDPVKMRRFDALVAACIDRGLYLTTDLFVSRMIPCKAIGAEGGGALVPSEDFKHLVFFHEGAYSNYLSFARNFLGHRNAFTGRTLAEEPAFGWVSLVNEGTLGNNGMDVFRRYPVIGERWRTWLAKKKRQSPDLFADVAETIPDDLTGKDSSSRAFVLFLADAERDFARRTTAFLRQEMKCRALTTNMNNWTYPAAYQVPRTDEYDYVDDHTYIDHPGFPTGYGKLPSTLDNGNPVRFGSRAIFGFASRRIFGRPFTVTEYNFCGPSAWRGTSGLLTGAQAVLQGWAGLWRFDWADWASVLKDRDSRGASCYFDICGDPMNLTAERAVVSLFLRRDMKPLKAENPLTLGRQELTTPTDTVVGPVTGLALSCGWNERLGTRLVPSGPRTDPKEATDETSRVAGLGQVVVDGRKGVFAVRTERTCGISAERGKLRSGVLTADIGETPATVWASSLDDAPIAASKRLLVAHLTDCQDSGLVYADPSQRNILLRGGKTPRLMRVGQADISLAVGEGAFSVFALASDGTRRERIPSRLDNGELRFRARTDLLSGACWLYDIERRTNVTTRVTGGFWRERLDVNARVTSGAVLDWADSIGAVANFKAAAEGRKNCHKGLQFTDAGLFQAVEGAARILSERPDPTLQARTAEIIGFICRAQEPDGYLYTPRTVGPADANTGTNRWANLKMSHELYQCGHLYEAGVQWWRATGDRRLLDCAKRNADFLCRTIGLEEGKLRIVAGHQELKLGLLSLAAATGERRYLELAKLEADMRGRADLRTLFTPYNGDRTYAQDHKPLKEQNEAVGHCVRAGYQYAAMAELVLKGVAPEFVDPIHAAWSDAVRGKTFLTGGVGSRHSTESFGEAFDLPNDFAYNETCAAIAMAHWHWRMFLLDREATYVDMLERVIYNNVLSGVSQKGDRFFYQNPLESAGGLTRFRHHWCNCCPPNLVRFLPQVPAFAFAVSGREVFANLYMDCETVLPLDGGRVVIEERTGYPFDGKIRLRVSEAARSGDFVLKLRIPGWATGDRPLPDGPYRQTPAQGGVTVRCNGKTLPTDCIDCGYLAVDRKWKWGDVVELELPMSFRRIEADERIVADRSCLAFERGPLVYCAEACDNRGRVFDRYIRSDAEVKEDVVRIGNREVPSFTVPSTSVWKGAGLPGGTIRREAAPLRFVPYCLWANRDAGEMRVWIPTSEEGVASHARPAASSCADGMTPAALNDGRVSNDWFDGIRDFAFADARSEQWVQYSLPSPERVGGVEVDWGIVRLWRPAVKTPPNAWKVVCRDGDGWRTLADGATAETRGAVTTLTFREPVETDAIRLVVAPGERIPAGIREWKLF